MANLAVSSEKQDPLIDQPGQRPAGFELSVLFIGFEESKVSDLRPLVTSRFDLLEADDLDEASNVLGTRPVAAICLGPAFEGAQAVELLSELSRKLPHQLTLNLIFSAGPDPTLFEDMVNRDQVFYLSRELPGRQDLIALLESAVAKYRSMFSMGIESESRPGDQAVRAHTTAGLLRQLAQQQDPADLAHLLADALRDALSASRAYCLLYDAAEDVLWTQESKKSGLRRESAAVGLMSFVVRSGMPVRLARVGGDPRYDPSADDPSGTGDERFLALPIVGSSGSVLAVVAAIRGPEAAEFVDVESYRAETLLGQVAPFFEPHFFESELQGDAAAQISSAQQHLFRPEALEYHLSSVEERKGDPLKISPAWSRWAYWALLLALLLGIVYTMVGEVREYATGQAVVRLAGRTDLTALSAQAVTSIEVEPGQDVEEGDILVRFHVAQEAAQLKRIEQEFELQLINRLRDPSDQAAEQALISLRTQRDLALANLEERILRAPNSGAVGDIRVQPGQYLTPGDIVLSLHRHEPTSSVIVMLPGEYRPLLRQGMPIRLEIAGYRYAYQNLVVDSVLDQVVSPREALRYLGPGGAEAVALTGPVVIVEAKTQSTHFEFQGRTYRYHEGMQGVAEVMVRSEKILLEIIPPLKALFGNDHG